MMSPVCTVVAGLPLNVTVAVDEGIHGSHSRRREVERLRRIDAGNYFHPDHADAGGRRDAKYRSWAGGVDRERGVKERLANGSVRQSDEDQGAGGGAAADLLNRKEGLGPAGKRGER